MRKYLEARNAFSISKLEAEADIARNAVHKWLKRNTTKGVEAKLSEPNTKKLAKLLADKYGFGK